MALRLVDFRKPGKHCVLVIQPERRADGSRCVIKGFQFRALGQRHRLRDRVADQNFVGLGGVFAELARRINLFAVDILIADTQYVALADADAQQHFILSGKIFAVALTGVIDAAVNHHQAVALGL